MSEKTDIVYVLGNGSKWANRELWFSLASVAKNMKDVGRIFVVGSNPGFLSDEVNFIPVVEQFDPKLNPTANVITKLLAAIKAGVSENFLYMNDDFVILKEISAAAVPPIHQRNFNNVANHFWNSGNHRIRLRKTYNLLKESNRTGLDFAVHVPMLLNAKQFKTAMANIDWKSGVGIDLRTWYGNHYLSKADNLVHQPDVNISRHYSLAQINARFSTEHFMSYNDRGLNRPLKMFLKQQFPNEHQYAKGPLPKLPKRQALHKRLA